MPIYEYICKDCEKGFEAWVAYSEADKVVCPHCQSAKTQRALSSFATPHKESSGCCQDFCERAGGCGCSGACRGH